MRGAGWGNIKGEKYILMAGILENQTIMKDFGSLQGDEKWHTEKVVSRETETTEKQAVNKQI